MLALDAAGATTGEAIRQIGLLTGGYAALDRLRIVAPDAGGDLGEPVKPIPPPATAWLPAAGLGALAAVRRRRRSGTGGATPPVSIPPARS